MSDGKLVIIGTPIGNLKDVTLRALEALSQVEILVCEDTRVTARLVNHYLKEGMLTQVPRYFAYNDFNERKVFPQVVEWVREGKAVGLVSDAGMPTVSDPGYRAVRACWDEQLKVEVVPGVSSVTTALAWAGMGGDAYYYVGFLPKQNSKRMAIWESVREIRSRARGVRVVVFVSPHRVLKDLVEVRERLGEVQVVMMRELTKVYEERVEASVSELIAKYEQAKPKGEMVMVIGESVRS